jgi:hypothetical protein
MLRLRAEVRSRRAQLMAEDNDDVGAHRMHACSGGAEAPWAHGGTETHSRRQATTSCRRLHLQQLQTRGRTDLLRLARVTRATNPRPDYRQRELATTTSSSNRIQRFLLRSVDRSPLPTACHTWRTHTILPCTGGRRYSTTYTYVRIHMHAHRHPQ